MLIARTPMRISFGGDGTDIEAYYARYGGLVVSIEEPLMPAQLALPTWEDCTQKLLTTYSVAAGREQCVS